MNLVNIQNFTLNNETSVKTEKEIFLAQLESRKCRHPQPPGPWTSTGWCPVKNWATEQEVSSGRASGASPIFTVTPYCLHHCLNSRKQAQGSH